MEFLNKKKYPIDKTGRSPDNLIRQERHQIHPEYRIVIPYHAGYFADSLIVMFNGRDLVLDTHYQYVDLNTEATTASGFAVYNGVKLIDTSINGEIYLTYQTYGDPLHPGVLAKYIQQMKDDQRLQEWGRIRNKPNFYPPEHHIHPASDITGLLPMAGGLHAIAFAITDLHSRMNKQAYGMFMNYNISMNKRLDGLQSSIEQVKQMDQRIVEIRNEANLTIESFKDELKRGLLDGTISTMGLREDERQSLVIQWTRDIAAAKTELNNNVLTVTDSISGLTDELSRIKALRYEPLREDGYYVKTSTLTDQITQHPKVQQIDTLLTQINARPTLLELNAEIAKQVQTVRWDNVIDKPSVVIRRPADASRNVDLDTLTQPDIYDVLPSAVASDRTGKHFPTNLPGRLTVSQINNNFILQEYTDVVGNTWSRSKDGNRTFTAWLSGSEINWNKVLGKPNYYPTRWQDIVGKPVDIEGATQWDDIQGKPTWIDGFNPSIVLMYSGNKIAVKQNQVFSLPTSTSLSTVTFENTDALKLVKGTNQAQLMMQDANTVSLVTRVGTYLFSVGNPNIRHVNGSTTNRFLLEDDLTWANVKNKPNFVTEDRLNNISWAQITNRPSVFPTDWNSVAGKPSQALRWPTWSEVTGKPEGIVTNLRNEKIDWSQLQNVPTTLSGLENVVKYTSPNKIAVPTLILGIDSFNIRTKENRVHFSDITSESSNYTMSFDGRSLVMNSPMVGTFEASLFNGQVYIQKHGSAKEQLIRESDFVWGGLKNKPSIFPTNWTNVADKPVYTTRWPAWGEVTGKPSQALRWPTWSEVSEKPTTFPSSWATISGMPANIAEWAKHPTTNFLNLASGGKITGSVTLTKPLILAESTKISISSPGTDEFRVDFPVVKPRTSPVVFSINPTLNLISFGNRLVAFNDDIANMAEKNKTNEFLEVNRFAKYIEIGNKTVDSTTKHALIIGYGTTDVYLRNTFANTYLQLKDNGELHFQNKRLVNVDDLNAVRPVWGNIQNIPTDLVNTASMTASVNRAVNDVKAWSDSKYLLKTQAKFLIDNTLPTTSILPFISREGTNAIFRIGNILQLNGGSKNVRVLINESTHSWDFQHRIRVPDISVTSDARVKSNIRRIDNASEKLQQLSGYTYTLNKLDDKPSSGVIAQEVQKVLPEAVEVDEASNELSVNYQGVIALLVETVKSQEKRITQLEAILGLQEMNV